MAKVNAFLSLYFLANFILVLNNTVVNSLKFRMIHSQSLESPFLQNNISHENRIKMLASSSQSSTHTNYNSTTPPSTIHADVIEHYYKYIVNIGIGTFNKKLPYKEYYLLMDTGSSHVWLQCEGCTECFKQKLPPFPKDKSSSFRPILNHTNYVSYSFKYADGDKTRGILAHETFYLKTKEGGTTKIEEIRFGCGLENQMKYWDHKNNKIAGIMGLGWGDTSFFQQLGPKTNGRFSYCMPVIIYKNTPSTYLRFGDDIPPHIRNTKSTPLYKWKQGKYYIEMQGISINNVTLNISQPVFAHSEPNCMMDTGTAYSRIKTPAFQILKLELQKYFSRFEGLNEINNDDDPGLELCYSYRRKAKKFKNLPSITFHLKGSRADFVLKAEAAFVEIGTRSYHDFCLAMTRYDEKFIIGSYQQTDHRIIYDTKNEQLMFYPEDCSNNP
ncbi:hypothetical protein CASFOL_025954 [Castilleja foliolosa]|uniref:Peptidase A1 domain-containing protein n=1 Tax=Castilleja foliolosa TaxID=1961234 RepID=A0ABD3CSK4_9LAMI